MNRKNSEPTPESLDTEAKASNKTCVFLTWAITATCATACGADKRREGRSGKPKRAEVKPELDRLTSEPKKLRNPKSDGGISCNGTAGCLSRLSSDKLRNLY